MQTQTQTNGASTMASKPSTRKSTKTQTAAQEAIAAPESGTMKVKDIVVDESFNTRVKYNAKHVDALVASFGEIGQQTAIIVRALPTDKEGVFTYAVRSGFTRMRALKKAGSKTAYVSVRPFSGDAAADLREDLKINATENAQREDLTVYETAIMLIRLSDDGMSGAQISDLLGTGFQKDHVNRLIKLGRGISGTAIVKAWKDEKSGVTVGFLETIHKLDAKEQDADWLKERSIDRKARNAADKADELVRGTKPTTTPGGSGGDNSGVSRPSLKKVLEALVKLEEVMKAGEIEEDIGVWVQRALEFAAGQNDRFVVQHVILADVTPKVKPQTETTPAVSA